MKQVVGYFHVPTERQGPSGLCSESSQTFTEMGTGKACCSDETTSMAGLTGAEIDEALGPGRLTRLHGP